MSTTTIPTPIETLAQQARLDNYRDSLVPTDAPLDAHIAFLRFLANAKPEDLDPDGDRNWALARIQTELQLISSTLQRQYDAVTRSAPPIALTDVVREVMSSCVNPTCDQSIAPWDAGAACSPECEAEAEQVI